ncbi:LuxR C-terminal-related transcriptional regulator [Streptomyces sp. NPDC001941]|uniref:helix-turn-helix transcriptional regulator n=1 Tax=Streptomyces sp. NPDC001941 TaxID=3154659 RepID=UPI003331EE37
MVSPDEARTAHLPCCSAHAELVPRVQERIEATRASLEGLWDCLVELRLALDEVVRACPVTDAPPTRVVRTGRTAASGARMGLTPKETEVVARLAAGMTNRSIARSLAVSERTVKNHLRSVFLKLGVNSRTEAALVAVEAGVVPAPSSPTSETVPRQGGAPSRW